MSLHIDKFWKKDSLTYIICVFYQYLVHSHPVTYTRYILTPLPSLLPHPHPPLLALAGMDYRERAGIYTP